MHWFAGEATDLRWGDLRREERRLEIGHLVLYVLRSLENGVAPEPTNLVADDVRDALAGLDTFEASDDPDKLIRAIVDGQPVASLARPFSCLATELARELECGERLLAAER